MVSLFLSNRMLLLQPFLVRPFTKCRTSNMSFRYSELIIPIASKQCHRHPVFLFAFQPQNTIYLKSASKNSWKITLLLLYYGAWSCCVFFVRNSSSIPFFFPSFSNKLACWYLSLWFISRGKQKPMNSKQQVNFQKDDGWWNTCSFANTEYYFCPFWHSHFDIQ